MTFSFTCLWNRVFLPGYWDQVWPIELSFTRLQIQLTLIRYSGFIELESLPVDVLHNLKPYAALIQLPSSFKVCKDRSRQYLFLSCDHLIKIDQWNSKAILWLRVIEPSAFFLKISDVVSLGNFIPKRLDQHFLSSFSRYNSFLFLL